VTTLQVAYLLILLAVIDWAFTALLIWAAHRVHEVSLLERAIASTILSIAATLVGILAATSVLLEGVTLPPEIRFALLVIALIMISLPQIIWGVLYLANRFD